MIYTFLFPKIICINSIFNSNIRKSKKQHRQHQRKKKNHSYSFLLLFCVWNIFLLLRKSGSHCVSTLRRTRMNKEEEEEEERLLPFGIIGAGSIFSEEVTA